MKTKDTLWTQGIQHLYLSRLNSITDARSHGLRQWLLVGDSFIVNPNATKISFSISLYNSLDIIVAIANDINRLSCASMELIHNFNESTLHKKFIAWNLVAMYYSAFFSAHCILKSTGFGLVQIDDNIANKLLSSATLYGVTMPKIESGIYCVDIDLQQSKAVFYKVSRYNDSHKGLWCRFNEFLGILLGTQIRTGLHDVSCIRNRIAAEAHPLSIISNMENSEAASLFGVINELQSYITKNGGSNWLSTTRNLINYNHQFGVWFPFNSYTTSYDKISNLYTSCYEVPNSPIFDKTGESELVAFTKTCQQINSINYSMLNDLFLRNPENKSFLRTGPYAYDKHYGNFVFNEN